jgi:hypothetical protein
MVNDNNGMMLCNRLAAIGPGPSKYYVDPSTDPTRPRAPAVSWGGPRQAAALSSLTNAHTNGNSNGNGGITSRSHKQQMMYNEAAEVGPAAYAPLIGVNRPTAPRAKFGTASRFGDRASDVAPSIYHPYVFFYPFTLSICHRCLVVLIGIINESIL